MKQWYAIYSRPRNEKKAYQLLSRKNIEAFCPLQKRLKQWSDRKKLVEEPLFTSYVFVKIGEQESEKLAVLQTPGVVQFVYWLGKPAVIRDTEIQEIKDFLNICDHNNIDTLDLNKNDLVEITRGALKGKQGIVIDKQNGKAYLRIESLHLALVAEVETSRLKKMGDGPLASS
jgi:transcription antitermination factor NusG